MQNRAGVVGAFIAGAAIVAVCVVSYGHSSSAPLSISLDAKKSALRQLASGRFQKLSSCVGSACGNFGTPANVLFGADKIDEKNVKESWLNDNMHNADMDGSDQGMYNGYASTRAYWHDTTYMDNLRTADITDHSVAGSLEDPIQDNTPANNVRGGHSIHTITDETFANDCLNHLEHSGKGGCSDYQLPDCNDGHCCPTSWIDDGWNDCHGNWGCHLMCYCDEKNDCPDA
jgi:hypothetical protein